MRGLARLTLMDILLYVREPVATFFTLAFPPLLVVLFGTIYGNDPSPLFAGRGSMDVSMPAYTALILGGSLLYHVRFEGNALLVLAGVLLCAVSMFSVGYLIASVASSARVAQVMGMVIFYPMMSLSGAGIPIEIMPESVRRISDFLPLTYAVRLLKGLWFGAPWSGMLVETVVLAGTMVICAFLTGRLFRWE
ncbi:MAG: ABC transporter permease [Gaiellales bacterium]|nr:ABC transporter permease [Gaiellales bacterium]